MAKRSTERVLDDEIRTADLAVEKARRHADARLAAAKDASAELETAHAALTLAEARALRARRARDAFLPLPFPTEPTLGLEASPPASDDGSIDVAEPEPSRPADELVADEFEVTHVAGLPR